MSFISLACLGDWCLHDSQITFAGLIVTTNIVAKYGSNYLPPGVAEELTPLERKNVIYGSKMTIVLEECTLCTLWLVKACMLLLYHRFKWVFCRSNLCRKRWITDWRHLETFWLWDEICWSSCLGSIVYLDLWSRSSHYLGLGVGRWADTGRSIREIVFKSSYMFPTLRLLLWHTSPVAQCANCRHHLIVVSTFNIMLFIPVPLLINSRLPIKR